MSETTTLIELGCDVKVYVNEVPRYLRGLLKGYRYFHIVRIIECELL